MPLLEHSSSPESILKPYLKAALSLKTPSSAESSTKPLFVTYYIQRLRCSPTSSHPFPSHPSDPLSTVLITPPPSTLLPESSDSAAINAEAVFRAAIHTLKYVSFTAGSANFDHGETVPFWPPIEAPENEVDEW
jgi:hypothetical protein